MILREGRLATSGNYWNSVKECKYTSCQPNKRFSFSLTLSPPCPPPKKSRWDNLEFLSHLFLPSRDNLCLLRPWIPTLRPSPWIFIEFGYCLCNLVINQWTKLIIRDYLPMLRIWLSPIAELWWQYKHKCILIVWYIRKIVLARFYCRKCFPKFNKVQKCSNVIDVVTSYINYQQRKVDVTTDTKLLLLILFHCFQLSFRSWFIFQAFPLSSGK